MYLNALMLIKTRVFQSNNTSLVCSHHKVLSFSSQDKRINVKNVKVVIIPVEIVCTLMLDDTRVIVFCFEENKGYNW